MDISDYLYTQLGSKDTPMILVMVTPLYAIIPAAAGVAPSVIAQEEETSLGEEDIAFSIISHFLDDDGCCH
jgi:hypothetical protein